MPDFNPNPNDTLDIGGRTYQVQPHPAVPSFAFGQEGRKAMVYQVRDAATGGLYALKKFKPAYRLPDLVHICDQLAQFSQWQGLEVCARACLTYGPHDDALGQYPDLEYAVLMPWIVGSTWYDMVIGETAVSKVEALTFAAAVAQVLAGLEESGLAHCDISAANVIISGVTSNAHLIDVEDLYVPGFPLPAALPSGTDGYAHKAVRSGRWDAVADRFAGAVLMCEMAAWFHPDIRHKADEEHYFAPDEMHQDSERYQLMRTVLVDLDERLGDLFDEMWFSDTLEECPRLNDWQDVFEDLPRQARLANVVGGWQPLMPPGMTVDIPGRGPAKPINPPPILPKSEPFPIPRPVSEPVVQQDDQEEEPAQPAASKLVNPAPAQPPASQGNGPAIAPPPPPTIRRTPSSIPAPPAGQGGPVSEWRPLGTVPVSASMGKARPIEVPVSPETSPSRPIVPPARKDPESFEVGGPGEGVPAFADEDDPVPAEFDDSWDDDPVMEAEDDSTYGDALWVEDDAEEIVSLDAPDPVDDALPQPGLVLLKPMLDLSHVDNRSRPHLVWTESQDAESYLLQESKDATFDSPKDITIKGDETYWSPLLPRRGRLHYRVRAEAGDDAGPWSDPLSIRVGDG